MPRKIQPARRTWPAYFGSMLASAHRHLGCDGAGVAVRGADGSALTLAASDGLAEAADVLQTRHADGPAVSPAWPRLQVLIADRGHDDPWPVWTRALGGLGVTGVLATQIVTPEDRNGSLTIYYRRRVQLGEAHLAVAELLARQTGDWLDHAEEVTHLRTAIESRTTIGQAQGVLMERFGLTADRAFAVLQRHASQSETKLRDIAAHLARGGRLDDVGIGIAADLEPVAAPPVTR